VDFSAFQKANAEAEERRLMPRYVEAHFLNASKEVGLKVEPRADGLWRAAHVLADLRSDRLTSVRRVGKADTEYRKLTFHKEHLDQDQHLDAALVGPGHALYAAVDEQLNERLSGLAGGIAVYVDSASETPYRLHLFELSIRGQNTKGEPQALHAELVAVREDLIAPPESPDRFAVVPADSLLDLPAHPAPPEALDPVDASVAADFLKGTFQMDLRARCQEERRHFVEVCRDYLEKAFDTRIRAARDRVMALRGREAGSPELALARQRAENDLTDLERTKRVRFAGLERLILAKHGPVRHFGTALVLPVGQAASLSDASLSDASLSDASLSDASLSDASLAGWPTEDLDPESRRRVEKAAEDLVIAHETARGWECERVGHKKIGFDIRSLGPADPQTGYRDPVQSIRRIEVKGRTRGAPIRLTTNEWYKAAQLGDSYWLYVVWDPLGEPDPEPLRIQNPVKHLDHAKREVLAARYYDILAADVERAALPQGGAEGIRRQAEIQGGA
jgi:hypothetical protein